MSAHGEAVWLGFTGLVVVLLVLDLGVLNRKSHVLSPKEAMTWSAGLVSLALLFGLFLLWREGSRHALEYYTGYLIELSLSVDNLFVFILIFQYFAVPAALQPRVLKWGILGAMVMRGIMISAGALLLQRFTWIIYVFGGILIVTGLRMGFQDEVRIEPEKNPVVRLTRRFLPFTPAYDGQHFFVRSSRQRLATPLLLVLLVVEWSDLVFAIDSIPAIFAITRDPFIVYSSNVFAILGLRALFFVLASAMDRFVYLKPGVALILVFVGTKMTLSAWIHSPILVSLGVIVLTLVTAAAASVLK
ncbi:MAG: TerC family protein, partial [Gemmatimonadales bacterium]